MFAQVTKEKVEKVKRYAKKDQRDQRKTKKISGRINPNISYLY